LVRGRNGLLAVLHATKVLEPEAEVAVLESILNAEEGLCKTELVKLKDVQVILTSQNILSCCHFIFSLSNQVCFKCKVRYIGYWLDENALEDLYSAQTFNI